MASPVFSTPRSLVSPAPSTFSKHRSCGSLSNRETIHSPRQDYPWTKPDYKQIEYIWKSSLPQGWKTDSNKVFTKKQPNRDSLRFLKESQDYIHEMRKPKIIGPETILETKTSLHRTKNIKSKSSTTLGNHNSSLSYSMKYVGVVDGALSILTSRVPLSKRTQLKPNLSISTHSNSLSKVPNLSLTSGTLSSATTPNNFGSPAPASPRVNTLIPQLSLHNVEAEKSNAYTPKSLSSPKPTTMRKKGNSRTAINELIAEFLNRFKEKAPAQALPKARNGVQGWKLIRLELKKALTQSRTSAIETRKGDTLTCRTHY